MSVDDLAPLPDPIRPYVAQQIARAGWGPVEALAWGKDRDVVDAFRRCVMLVRLCGDPVARADPLHRLIHRGYRINGCAGPDLLFVTQHALGISDDRARYLIDQLDAETNVAEGLTGAG